MTIELKSVKIAKHLSEETTAFTASVWLDGKRVGTARNDGRGGCTMLHVGERHNDVVDACLAHPAGSGLTGKYSRGIAVDAVVEHLLSQVEETRYLKRRCRTKTVVITKDLEPGQVLEFKLAYSFRTAAMIRERYDVVEIVNERWTR